jgi:hypothetical protein
MPNRVLERVLRISCRAYGLLLPLYPPTLRWQFGSDMVDVFEQQMRAECEERGFAGVTRVWLSIGLDVIQNALPDEMSWQSALIPVFSLLGSLALFALFFAANGLAKHCIK